MKEKSTKRRSFIPKNPKPLKRLMYREADAIAGYIGIEEPKWPSPEEQRAWTDDDYQNKLSECFGWYAHCQDGKKGQDLAIAALSASGHRPELIAAIKNSTSKIPITESWMIRMILMGAMLNLKHRKKIAKAIRKCAKNAVLTIEEMENKPSKLNIQDFINAKLRRVKGEIDSQFDDFIGCEYKNTLGTGVVMSILNDPEIAAPGNRMKDLIEHCEKYLKEYRMVLAGTNDDLNEAYGHLGRRQLKACISWWENAISDISVFGAHKKSARKPRKKKEKSPAKIVERLRFLKEHTELNLKSIDPTQILKCSELWIFDCKRRKLGHFVSVAGATLDVKGTKLLNVDSSKSICKTLRKPQEQLKKFNSLGKPAALKFFNEIRAVSVTLREKITADSILLKAVK